MTAPCIVTWWKHLRDPSGREEQLITWQALFERFAEPSEYRGDDEQPGWSPARFDGQRRGREHVRRVFALCLDYDGGEPFESVSERWDGTLGFVHTTRKHRPEAPRCRVILPLRRDVSPFEFDALWRRLSGHAGPIDEAPKDPSRFWFVPGAPTGAEYITRQLAGEPLDPDHWLSKIDPTPHAARAPSPPTVDVERRALAYLAKMPPAISGSGGHGALWDAALVLARGFGLGESATLRLLADHYNPRCEPEWSERELEHKARDAARANVPDGYLLEDDTRPWQSHRALLPPADDAPHPAEAETPDEPANVLAEPEPESAVRERVAPAVHDSRDAAARYELISMRALMADIAEDLQRPAERTKRARTGSGELDAAIGGFRPGHVTVFGAKRGFGKTSYGNLVTDLAMHTHRVVLFAGEDASKIYGRRFLAARADLNAMMLRDNRCNREDWPKIMRAIADAPDNPFLCPVKGRPVEWIAQAISDLHEEQPVDLVIVDYLQCLKTTKRTQDRRNEVTHVCGTVSQAIKRVNAAGLLFSQLKRTERPEPEVEDLKESGDIEDMADHILLGWKVEKMLAGTPSVERRIKVGKNKDGIDASEIRPVTMGWNRKTASFIETLGAQEFSDADYEERRYGV